MLCELKPLPLSDLKTLLILPKRCAVGATLTSRYCPDLPESLVDFFSTRSKALLEVEMDSPTLSTVQSLGILSGVEALLTRDARGWLYSGKFEALRKRAFIANYFIIGMAMRLATDLGLHIDAAPFAERGLMDLEEAQLRSSTFWGTYIHERYVHGPGQESSGILIKLQDVELVCRKTGID